MTLSETHRPGTHALRLGESDDEPVYMYNLRARTRDPAEVRAASRDEMPELVLTETTRLLEATAAYPNFIVSSGCDIPPLVPEANVDAFELALMRFNTGR